MSNVIHRNIRKKALPRTGRELDAMPGGMVPGGGSISSGGGSVTVDAEFDILNGEAIKVEKTTVSNRLTYTIHHEDTSVASSSQNIDDFFLQNIEVDTFGHVTSLESVRVAASLGERYLRKDINDTAHGIILFDQKIGSSIFLDGYDGKGWEIKETGAALFDSAQVRSDIFMGGKIGSPSFASGFTGWGWEIDSPTASGTVDNWTVRKSMKVYEMVYSQIYGLNSSFLVSDWNKIKEVLPLGTSRYRLTIDKEDNMLMNLRKGDIVRM
ncbi:MAG: hypothetical protein LUH01_01020 [Parabacteroides gordonii]|nr:hypothetical protein [Parabacteroides gordonii]